MTKPMMDLRELVEKSGAADLLREMIGFAAERLMDLEVGSRTGAAYGEKSPERQAQRNGYRDRAGLFDIRRSDQMSDIPALIVLGHRIRLVGDREHLQLLKAVRDQRPAKHADEAVELAIAIVHQWGEDALRQAVRVRRNTRPDLLEF